MQHQPKPYEVGQQGNEYSQGRHIASDAIRGFVSGLRGYMEGRKLKRDAKDAREMRYANEAFRWKALEMQDRQMQLDEGFRQDQLDTTKELGTRAADTADAKVTMQETMQQAYFQHQLAITNLQAEIAQAQTELEHANREGLVDKAAQIQQDLTRLQSDLAIEQSDADYAHRKALAQDAAENASKLQQEGSQQRQNEIRTTGEEARKTQAEGIEGETKAYTDKLEAQMNALAERNLLGLDNLTDSGRGWYKDVLNEIQQDLTYQRLVDAHHQWATILGSIQDDTGASDLALINTFQRMIDPGVSVREGDVELIKTTNGFLQRLENMKRELEEGRLLHPETRNDLTSTAKNILDKQQQLFYTRIKTYADGMIDMHPELKGRFTFESIVPQIFGKLPQTAGTIDGRVPGTEATQTQELSEEWIEKLVTNTIDAAVPIIDADPNFDEADQQQVRQMLEDALRQMGEKAGVGDAYVKYADDIFTRALRQLGIDLEGRQNPEGAEE